ncbi:hypothetical protein IAT40_007451 [Kwoniella sp. CBS 6097]
MLTLKVYMITLEQVMVARTKRRNPEKGKERAKSAEPFEQGSATDATSREHLGLDPAPGYNTNPLGVASSFRHDYSLAPPYPTLNQALDLNSHSYAFDATFTLDNPYPSATFGPSSQVAGPSSQPQPMQQHPRFGPPPVDSGLDFRILGGIAPAAPSTQNGNGAIDPRLLDLQP